MRPSLALLIFTVYAKNIEKKIGDDMKVALFDFDGTIYKKETFPLLMKHLKEHPTFKHRYQQFFRSALLPYLAYKIKLYPEEKMKYVMMQKYLQAFKGVTIYELDLFFMSLVENMKADLNNTVIQRMQQHASDGYHIMIVSGAFTPILQFIAEDLPVDTFIGTDVPEKNGLYDENIKITHVQGEMKNKLVLESVQGVNVDWADSFAYGDSASDIPLLKLVGNPVAVNPDETLQDEATNNGWETLS